MSAVQPPLPVLPEDTKDTEVLLDAAAGPIRDTFFRSLKAVLALPASSDRSPYKQAYKSALELAQRPESLSLAANAVHLQICVLLLFIASTYGPVDPATIDEPNEKILYGTAQGIAGVMGLTTSGAPPSGGDSTEELAASAGRRAYGLFHYLSAWSALAHGHSPYVPAQDFAPNAADGRLTSTDSFLLAAMVPDLAAFRARFAKKGAAAEVGSLFFDGVVFGLGVVARERSKLDPAVRAGQACLEICRAVAESSGKIVAVPPAMLTAAADVVSAYATEPAPFYAAGHHTFALAVRVLGLGARHTSTREDALAALKVASGLLETGKFLHEDGWRRPIEKAVKKAASEKAQDKPLGVSLIDVVHKGWMGFFA